MSTANNTSNRRNFFKIVPAVAAYGVTVKVARINGAARPPDFRERVLKMSAVIRFFHVHYFIGSALLIFAFSMIWLVLALWRAPLKKENVIICPACDGTGARPSVVKGGRIDMVTCRECRGRGDIVV